MPDFLMADFWMNCNSVEMAAVENRHYTIGNIIQGAHLNDPKTYYSYFTPHWKPTEK